MSCNLITGGFGFIGCYLARHLVGEGENIIIFDVATGSRLVDSIRGQFKAVRGDLTNWAQIFEVIKTNRVNTIYHLGSLLRPESEENLWLAYQVNVTGTVNILEAARILEVANVIYVSSSGSYGSYTQATINEDMPQRPETMYGVTKVCSERLGEQYQRKHGVNFRAVRFPPVIGPGRTAGQPSFFTCQMIEESALGRPYSVNVAPETSTPALYVKDAVRCLIGLKQASETQLKRRVYNIHGFSSSAKELAEAILRYIPQAKIDFKPEQAVVDSLKKAPKRLDDTRAKEEWGWEAHYDLHGAVGDFITEIKANPTIFT